MHEHVVSALLARTGCRLMLASEGDRTDTTLVLETDWLLNGPAASAPPLPAEPGRCLPGSATVIATSASSGAAKLVVHGLAEHIAIAAFALASDYQWALLAFIPVNLLNVVFAPPTYSLTQGLAQLRMRAMASAIVLFVLNLIGLGLGPTLVGVLNDALEPRYGVQAIRWSLMLLLIAGSWGVVHSLLAARTLERDLRRAGIGR